jgi:uncharacterized protein
MQENPWYSNGLRFECTQCGDCCTGSTGYVWVNQEEIEALARATGVDAGTLEEKYVRNVGARKTLREFPNGDCVFFDPQARCCSVYQARPRQCRSWPFWDSNLRAPDDWLRTCEVCPGSGKGKLYPLEEIEKDRRLIRI